MSLPLHGAHSFQQFAKKGREILIREGNLRSPGAADPDAGSTLTGKLIIINDVPKYSNSTLLEALRFLDIGSSVAESDHLLETARVETSVFTDLLAGRVDLIPGTKGSGKTALYRIFVEFLPRMLFERRKVVVAHGVTGAGDSVFHAFRSEFEVLEEEDFVRFWCIYLVSLTDAQFLRGEMYREAVAEHQRPIEAFRRACQRAGIPQIVPRKSLYEVLQWLIRRIPRPRKLSVTTADQTQYTLELGVEESEVIGAEQFESLPQYVGDIKDALEQLLTRANLELWLMIDRLDEVFPRRSEIETKALRGLLRAMRVFSADRVRVKVFLRDDILQQITVKDGFTALTHVTARQADSLRWSEDQILTLVVNRLFATEALRAILGVDREKLTASGEYRREAFYRFFPPTVHSGDRQSPTLRWVYTHTADGNDVVTPRDVIDLLTRAKQRQQDEFEGNPAGGSDWVIGPLALRYGLEELSRRKRDTYLRAEFPHFWPYIERLVGGKTEYSEKALVDLLGTEASTILPDLEAIGLLFPTTHTGIRSYKVPFLYRDGLQLSQGFAE